VLIRNPERLGAGQSGVDCEKLPLSETRKRGYFVGRKTYLDGAACRTRNGAPVVALTLRYDRADYFWFALLHETDNHRFFGKRFRDRLDREALGREK
jgi:hypothetical protein